MYQSRHVRITRKDQQQFEGFISLMDNGDARLIQRRLGGEFGVIIPRQQVQRVEVRNESLESRDGPIVVAGSG